MKELKRVVVTGLGALTPVGNNVADTWNALIEGKNGVGAITQFDATLFKTQFAAEVKNFDPRHQQSQRPYCLQIKNKRQRTKDP